MKFSTDSQCLKLFFLVTALSFDCLKQFSNFRVICWHWIGSYCTYVLRLTAVEHSSTYQCHMHVGSSRKVHIFLYPEQNKVLVHVVIWFSISYFWGGGIPLSREQARNKMTTWILGSPLLSTYYPTRTLQRQEVQKCSSSQDVCDL